MAWYFGDVRIYVQKYETDSKQVIARLQPLNNKTILHLFGWESEKLNLGGLVVTNSGVSTLKSYRTTGLAYTLSGPEGTVGDFYVSNIKAPRLDTINICLNDRPGLDPLSPVYSVNLELYIDDD